MAFVRFGIDRLPRSREDQVSRWKLAALLFFDPKFATSRDITELLNTLDAFSGDDLDIFLHGYTAQPSPLVDQKDSVPVRVGKREMYYDPSSLASEVRRIEKDTNWRFSLEIDVILVKQRQHYFGDGGFERDWRNVVAMNLYRMLQDKKITSYASFFGEIIRFCEDYEGKNPAWDFSNRVLWEKAKTSLFEAFKAYLGYRQFQIKVEDYAIQDLRRK